MKARLEAIAEAELRPARVDVMRPWEQLPNALANETPESRRLIFGVAQLEPGTHDPKSLLIAGARRAIDEDVPMLGGRPRDLVREVEGRLRVERWLEEQELRGMPGDDAFVDLDAVRRELGLRTVNPLLDPS